MKSTNSLTEQGNSVSIQVAQVEDQLNKCHIQSPIEGTVLAKYAEAGELASVGKPLFKVGEVDRMYGHLDFGPFGVYPQNDSD